MRLLIFLFLAASLSECRGVGVLRGSIIKQGREQDSMEKDGKKSGVSDIDGRKLSWKFVPEGKVYDDDEWYADYSGVDFNARADPEDFLRRSDVCYKNGRYSRSNCPSEPNCNRTGKWGPAKLCINRHPMGDGGGYHVLAMKCIPSWENCDKCFCGIISSETESGVCMRAARQGPDDDRVRLDCNGDVSRVSIKGKSFDSSSKGRNRNDDDNSGGYNDGYSGHDDVLFAIYRVNKQQEDDYYIF